METLADPLKNQEARNFLSKIFSYSSSYYDFLSRARYYEEDPGLRNFMKKVNVALEEIVEFNWENRLPLPDFDDVLVDKILESL